MLVDQNQEKVRVPRGLDLLSLKALAFPALRTHNSSLCSIGLAYCSVLAYPHEAFGAI